MLTSLQAAFRPYSRANDRTAKTLHRFLGVDYTIVIIQQSRNFMNAQYAPYNIAQSWIFCGDYFTQPKQWTDILEDVPEYTTEKVRGSVPYWIDSRNRYAFSLPNAPNPGQRGTTPSGICMNADGNPLAVHIRTLDRISVLTICDPMYRPSNGNNRFTLFPSILRSLMCHLRPARNSTTT
ncbi:hypothetical protein RRF57_011016 [Xylaria bambusicola]|uniref:Uncharacterized protein n=1 Tax=Xylaria bambusicola TaxID=326684 RepID=A0AAN7UVW8_9PEZI